MPATRPYRKKGARGQGPLLEGMSVVGDAVRDVACRHVQACTVDVVLGVVEEDVGAEGI